MKRVALEQSKIHYLLADHEKFEHAALMTYGQIADLDYLITNRELEEAYRRYLQEHEVTLVIISK